MGASSSKLVVMASCWCVGALSKSSEMCGCVAVKHIGFEPSRIRISGYRDIYQTELALRGSAGSVAAP